MIKSVLLTCAFSFLTALNVPLKTMDQFKADEEVLEKSQKKELYNEDIGLTKMDDLPSVTNNDYVFTFNNKKLPSLYEYEYMLNGKWNYSSILNEFWESSSNYIVFDIDGVTFTKATFYLIYYPQHSNISHYGWQFENLNDTLIVEYSVKTNGTIEIRNDLQGKQVTISSLQGNFGTFLDNIYYKSLIYYFSQYKFTQKSFRIQPDSYPVLFVSSDYAYDCLVYYENNNNPFDVVIYRGSFAYENIVYQQISLHYAPLNNRDIGYYVPSQWKSFGNSFYNNNYYYCEYMEFRNYETMTSYQFVFYEDYEEMGQNIGIIVNLSFRKQFDLTLYNCSSYEISSNVYNNTISYQNLDYYSLFNRGGSSVLIVNDDDYNWDLSIDLLVRTMNGFGSFFNIMVLPGLSIGGLLFLPLFATLLIFVVKLFKR